MTLKECCQQIGRGCYTLVSRRSLGFKLRDETLTFFHLTEELLLFGNNFAPQPLPQSLFNLFNLTYLDLSEGAFTGNLPALDNLQMLEKLYLNDNQLQGPLPASLPPLLEDIWLNNNSFSGGIPSLFGANSANLSTVLLHDNRLNGTMATGLCDKALTRLEADCLNSTLPDYVACPSDCCTACF